MLTVVLGLAYPLAITGISQVVFPGKANGSKVKVDGKVVGSSLIGQSFSEPEIGKNGKPVLDEEGEEVLVAEPGLLPAAALGRPATRATSPTSATPAPTASKRAKKCANTSKAYLQLEKPFDKSLTSEDVPVDAVTQSASGVDPHISQANARIQAHRIAAVRQLPLTQVEDLISAHTDGRFLGLLGEPGVNVLELNIALDKEAPLK